LSRRRTFLIVFLILVGFTAVGSATTLERSEAERILEDVRKIIPDKPNAIDIFSNNIMIALLMLIPGFGLILAPYVLYNTGLVFSATGLANNVSGITLLLTTTILPFFWLEFAAYAASVTQNLTRRLDRDDLYFILTLTLLLAFSSNQGICFLTRASISSLPILVSLPSSYIALISLCISTTPGVDFVTLFSPVSLK